MNAEAAGAGYLPPTDECLDRLGLCAADLDAFVGLGVEEARSRAAGLGLRLYEAVVDGVDRPRIMILLCDWLSVAVRDGRVDRVLGLG